MSKRRGINNLFRTINNDNETSTQDFLFPEPPKSHFPHVSFNQNLFDLPDKPKSFNHNVQQHDQQLEEQIINLQRRIHELTYNDQSKQKEIYKLKTLIKDNTDAKSENDELKLKITDIKNECQRLFDENKAIQKEANKQIQKLLDEKDDLTDQIQSLKDENFKAGLLLSQTRPKREYEKLDEENNKLKAFIQEMKQKEYENNEELQTIRQENIELKHIIETSNFQDLTEQNEELKRKLSIATEAINIYQKALRENGNEDQDYIKQIEELTIQLQQKEQENVDIQVNLNRKYLGRIEDLKQQLEEKQRQIDDIEALTKQNWEDLKTQYRNYDEKLQQKIRDLIKDFQFQMEQKEAEINSLKDKLKNKEQAFPKEYEETINKLNQEKVELINIINQMKKEQQNNEDKQFSSGKAFSQYEKKIQELEEDNKELQNAFQLAIEKQKDWENKLKEQYEYYKRDYKARVDKELQTQVNIYNERLKQNLDVYNQHKKDLERQIEELNYQLQAKRDKANFDHIKAVSEMQAYKESPELRNKNVYHEKFVEQVKEMQQNERHKRQMNHIRNEGEAIRTTYDEQMKTQNHLNAKRNYLIKKNISEFQAIARIKYNEYQKQTPSFIHDYKTNRYYYLAEKLAELQEPEEGENETYYYKVINNKGNSYLYVSPKYKT